MKKFRLLFLLLSIFVSSPVLAQITLTTADVLNMYSVGKGQKQISAVDTTTYTMNVGVESALQTQTWSLPNTQYPDTVIYTNVTPSSTPYANKFPSATHAQVLSLVDIATGYNYFRITNDSLIFIGSAITYHFSTDTTEIDSVSHFVFKMPLTLGTVITSHDSLYFGLGNYTIINSIKTIDAFGTITAPNGSFQCLREKSIDIEENYNGTLVTKDTSVFFDWFTKEGHIAQAAAANNTETSGNISVVSPFYQVLVNIPLGVSEGHTTLPNTFALLQNYPNPFNPTTTIDFSLPTNAYTRLAIYNVLGEEVAVLADGMQNAGEHKFVFNAKGLSSGVYFYRLNTFGKIQTCKMNLVK